MSSQNRFKALILCLIFLFAASVTFSQATFTRVTNSPVVFETMESGGAAWVDINNDGLLDLFVANGNLSNQNNSLFLNTGSGNFIKIVSGTVGNDGGSSIGSTWADFQNDGNLDLFVTNRNNFGNFMYFGNGDTTFTKITAGPPVTDLGNSNSSSWADLNRDGYIDLYVVNFSGNDFLYINNGPPNFTFTKIDTASYLQDGSGFSIAGAWGDYNNDRRPDYYICNSGTENDFLYTNTGTLAFNKMVIPDSRASLGASWSDYDNDGDLDLFVANFLNHKSLLYNNTGAPGYILIRIDTGIVSNDPANSIGSCWADFDNDGDLDLFVSNDGQNNFLYINNGPPDYSFTKVTTGSIVSEGGNSFGCACGDFDNDGQIDVFVANRLNQANFLYHNDGNNNKWITIRCEGTISNESAIGTKVKLKAIINGDARWQMQEVFAQTGYNSQNLWLHFGLGNAAIIDSIKVEWINGTTTYHTNVNVNQNITVREDGVIIGISSLSNEIPLSSFLYQNYPNPFNPVTKIRFAIPGSSNVLLTVFDITGKAVSVPVNSFLHAGIYESDFDASMLASGVYFYRLETAGYTETKKMVLIK